MSDLLSGGKKRWEPDGLKIAFVCVAVLCFVVGFALGHAT